MNLRHKLLIGFALVSLLLASGVVYVSQKVETFIVEQGASGALLAARQASRMNDAQSAGAFYALALTARPDDATLMGEAMQAQILAGQMLQAVASAEAIVSLQDDVKSGSDKRQAQLLLAVHAFK